MAVPGQGFPPTAERGDGAESLPAGLPRRGLAADHSPHSAPLPCHAPPGSGSRHPHDPSLAGPSSHRDHGSVHARHLGGSAAGGQPARPPAPAGPIDPATNLGSGRAAVWSRVLETLAPMPPCAADPSGPGALPHARRIGRARHPVRSLRRGTVPLSFLRQPKLSSVRWEQAGGLAGQMSGRPPAVPTPTSSSPCPTSSAHWYWATVSSCIGCSLTAQETLLEVAADPMHLGAQIGVLMVLHTSGLQLEHHPHVHCVVPGGGLAIPAKTSGNVATDPDDQAPRWVSCGPAGSCRSRCSARSSAASTWRPCTAYQAGQLQFAGSTLPLKSPAAWATSIRHCTEDWVVYAKEPFGGPGAGAEILDRVHSPSRLEQSPSGEARGRSGHLPLEGLRRRLPAQGDDAGRGGIRAPVALHIIPKGLVRIRQFGLLAHRDRGERLALCRSLLAAGARPAPETESPPTSASRGSTDSDQSPSGAEPAPPLVGLKSAARPGWVSAILVVLVSLLVASGDTTSFASSPAVPPAAVLVDDRCPGCGVGHLQTIWQAGRPGRVERQRIPILDSS